MRQDPALVIATFSRRMRLRLADGTEVDARIKGKLLRPVCGDRVSAEAIPGESEWLITDIHERDNVLGRPNLRGKTEILAANVELLVVVAARAPPPDWFIVDRYLSAAASMNVPAVVIFNKTDMQVRDTSSDIELSDYSRMGYPTLSCSAKTGAGIDAIQEVLAGRLAIIVGQSGVGKSSIINRLIGGEQQRTAAISHKTGEGRHTTVNSMMLTLPGGGEVIDSPGVRDYAPALESTGHVMHGFREIDQASQNCRFANCRHLREPGCAVKDAVDNDAISPRRYESYRRLLALTDKLEKRT